MDMGGFFVTRSGIKGARRLVGGGVRPREVSARGEPCEGVMPGQMRVQWR